MKKYLWSLLALLTVTAVSINLTSCGDDDDDGVSIVGDWYTKEANFPVYQFYADGTVTSSYYEDSNNGNHSAIYTESAVKMRDKGKYQLNGNNLIIRWLTHQEWNERSNSWGTVEDFDDDEIQHFTISLSGNTLKFIYFLEDNDFSELTLTRK